MSDGFELVCPACGEAADLSAGLRPDESGRLLCDDCGAEIPIPEADPDDSVGDDTTIVDPPGHGPPAEVDTDSIEAELGDCGSGRYSQQETIGAGGMGEIVLCIEQNTRREVAMKRMLPTAAGHAKQRARFVEEAQVTAQLEHPNIVPVHELGRDADGAIYFTMKLVKGRSLGEILTAARDGEESHSLVELLGVFLKVCDGVAFAHSRGVVHRDLKPANIMVGDFGEVLVMDWGIARIVGRDENEEGVKTNRQDATAMHTMVGSIMGSPPYMPPEQAAGELEKIDHRSDIYSLGAILYTILALKSPVEGGTARAILDTVIAGDIQPPEQRAADRDIPRELSAVVMKCLARFRGRRYQSVPDLQRDVSLYLEGRSVSAAPDTFGQAFVKLIKRNKPVSVAVGAAAMILIAVVSIAFMRVSEERDVAVTERQAARAARDKQRATALAASESLAGLAVRAAEQGRLAEADVRADTALEVLPDGPWGHYALGVVAMERKQFDAAREHLSQALELDADHNPSKVFLSRVLTLTGDLARADALVAKAGDVDNWRNLLVAGDALVSARRYDMAIKAYERVDELMNSDATTPPRKQSETKDKLSRARLCLEFEGFVESIRSLPTKERTEKLGAKFKEIYGPDIEVSFRIEKGGLTGISIKGKSVRWLDPFRGMHLTSFSCLETSVVDLSPLRGMPLTYFSCAGTKLRDLGPLKGMPLKSIYIWHTNVADLSPLLNTPLEELHCGACRVRDLTVLKGMKQLTTLSMGQLNLRSLEGIEGMELHTLWFPDTPIDDLTPLKGMPLRSLQIQETNVKDLTPLAGMKLEKLALTPKNITKGIEIVRGMKSIRKIGPKWNHQHYHGPKTTPEQFWKKYDAGEFE